VDLAQFYVTHPDLIDALCALPAKGIQVRLLTDVTMGEAAQQPTLDKLTRHGVLLYLIEPPKRGKMHMKCLVVDAKTVVAGTANWTQQAFDLNFEDTLKIASPALAAVYLAKMDELTSSDMASEVHGSGAKPARLNFPLPKPPVVRTPPGRVNAPGGRKFTVPAPESFFLPNPEPFDRLAAQIRSATSRIDVAIFLLNEDRIVSALTERAKARGCAIRILADVGMLGSGNLEVLQNLATAGVEIRTFGSDRENLHMKTGVIDGHFFWTGSANWTKGAMSLNVEDMLCFDAPELAAWYGKWMDGFAKVCQPFAPLQAQTASNATHPAPAGKWPVGLPSTAPRADWDHLVEHVDFPPLETNAWTAYLPDEAYAPVLLDLIRKAHQTILIAMYKVAESGEKAAAGFHGQIVSELEKAAARGVYVSLLLHVPVSPQDALYDAHSHWAERLRAKGIDVRLSLPTLPMHEKFVSVDLCKVLVGSHNWSEGALDGSRVYESSALVVYPQQQKWLADYFFSRPSVSDMSSREAWERELTLIRHAKNMDDNLEKYQFLESLGVETEATP
jgi:phosphatidylserine/phosphatidylglycerophosphate/cardiolipin synthase-like enzyme